MAAEPRRLRGPLTQALPIVFENTLGFASIFEIQQNRRHAQADHDQPIDPVSGGKR